MKAFILGVILSVTGWIPVQLAAQPSTPKFDIVELRIFNPDNNKLIVTHVALPSNSPYAFCFSSTRANMTITCYIEVMRKNVKDANGEPTQEVVYEPETLMVQKR